MSSDSRFFDDLARIAGGAAGLAGTLRRQMREEVRQCVDSLATRLDLVPREDFERMESLVERLRTEQDSLAARIRFLESGAHTKNKQKSPTTQS